MKLQIVVSLRRLAEGTDNDTFVVKYTAVAFVALLPIDSRLLKPSAFFGSRYWRLDQLVN